MSATITLNPNGGSGGTTDFQCNWDSDLPGITPPTRTGYTFTGYFNEDGEKYYNDDGSAYYTSGFGRPCDYVGSVTLYAHWTPITYSITYKDEGNVTFSGTHASNYPTKHTYGTATTLKNPTKTGYTFVGWYTTSDCSGTAVTSLGATDYTDNITLYAKWKKDVACLGPYNAGDKSNCYDTFAGAVAARDAQDIYLYATPTAKESAVAVSSGVTIYLYGENAGSITTTADSVFDYLEDGTLVLKSGAVKVVGPTGSAMLAVDVPDGEDGDNIHEIELADKSDDGNDLTLGFDGDKLVLTNVNEADEIKLDNKEISPKGGDIEISDPMRPFPGAKEVVIPAEGGGNPVSLDPDGDSPTAATPTDPKNQGDVTITPPTEEEDTDGDGFPVKVTVEEVGDQVIIDPDGAGTAPAMSFEATQEDTELSVNDDGEVVLDEGGVAMDPGEKITLELENKDVVIENSGEGTTEVEVEINEDGTCSVEVDQNGEVTIGNVEYSNGGSDPLLLEVEEDGDVTLRSGTVELDKGTDGNGESIIVPTGTPYTVTNAGGDDGDSIKVTVNKDEEGDVIGSNIAVPSGSSFAINKDDGSKETYTADGELTSVYVTDGSGNVKLGTSGETDTGVALKLDKGTVTLKDGQSVYSNTDVGVLILNPLNTLDDSIVINAGDGTVDTTATLAKDQIISLGGTLKNGEITGASQYTAANGGAVLALDKTNSNYTDGTTLLQSGAVKLDAADEPIGVVGASSYYVIGVPEGKPTATVTKGADAGTCTIEIPAKSGDVSGEVAVATGAKLYRYINDSANPVTVPVKADGTIKTVLNDTGISSDLPGGFYEAFCIRTISDETTYTFNDDLDAVLAKANTQSGDKIVLNTNLSTNPTTGGYVLTTNKIDIYTAQGNLAKNNGSRTDVDYDIDGVFANIFTVDARERAEFYKLAQSFASQLESCLVVKVSNETGEPGHVQVQAGEAKIKWSDDDTTYYVTLADAIYDASHDTMDGIATNPYNTHDGANKMSESDPTVVEEYNDQIIEMNINPYEDRTGLVLEAGDTLIIRGEDSSKPGDSYTGVDTDDFDTPADVTVSMYTGKNDVYVVSGTAKVTDNTDSAAEVNGFADCYVGAKDAGYYAEDEGTFYVTAGTTADGRADGAAYVTTAVAEQSIVIGMGAGSVTYTGVTAGDTFPIAAIGELDTTYECVKVKDGDITADYTVYSVLDEDGSAAKIVVDHTNSQSGEVGIINGKDVKVAEVVLTKAGQTVSIDPMGDDTNTTATGYTSAKDGADIAVVPNSGANDPNYKYVAGLVSGAVKLDKDEAIYEIGETAAEVKILNIDDEIITVEAAPVICVKVAVPGGGTFEVYDKDGNKTGLNGVTSAKSDTIFFVDENGHITLLDGEVTVAPNGSLNIYGSDEKITNGNTDGDLTIKAVYSDGDDETYADVIIPAGKTASFDNNDGDAQTYTNPTVKVDGEPSYTNNDSATTITLQPDGKRVVTGGDIELDNGESIYVTNAKVDILTNAPTTVNVPKSDSLTLVTGTGTRNIQVAYDNNNPLGLFEGTAGTPTENAPWNTVSIPEEGEAKFVDTEGNVRYVSVPNNGDDLELRSLEAAVEADADQDVLVSFPKCTTPDVFASVGSKSVSDANSDQITYGNKDNANPTIIGVAADGEAYVKHSSAPAEGTILLDPQESINVELADGKTKVTNTAPTENDTKKVYVGQEETKGGVVVNLITVAKDSSVNIGGTEFANVPENKTPQSTCILDVVKETGSVNVTVPADDSITINGVEYTAETECKLTVAPGDPETTEDDVITLVSGKLSVPEDGKVTADGKAVENGGPESIEINKDAAPVEVVIPADNTAVIDGVEIETDADVTVKLSDPLEIEVPAGGSVTVDGIVYTNETNTAKTLTIDPDTKLPPDAETATGSTVFNDFAVSAPDGLKEDQKFVVPAGEDITVNGKTYTAGSEPVSVEPAASGKDPEVTIPDGETVTVKVGDKETTYTAAGETEIVVKGDKDVTLNKGGLDVTGKDPMKINGMTFTGETEDTAYTVEKTTDGLELDVRTADEKVTAAFSAKDQKLVVGADTYTSANSYGKLDAIDGAPDTAEAASGTTIAAKKDDTGAEIPNQYTVTGPVPASAPTITVPVSGEGGSIEVKVTVDENTAKLSAPTSQQLDKVLNKSVDTGVVSIDLTGLDEEISDVILSTGMAEKIAAAAADDANDVDGLAVKLATAEVAFDATALQAVVDQAKGKEIEIVVEKVGTSRLNETQMEALENADVREGYEAYVISGGERISDFGGGNVSVMIPFVLDEGTEAEEYDVYYVSDDGELTKLNATYDTEKLCFVVTHFSDYVVVYEGKEGYLACPKDDTCPSARFTDVDVTEWYHDGVHFCVENGIMNGVADTEFDITGDVTRAQIVTMLWRLEGEPVANYAMDFEDVAEEQWYTEAVRWAASEGIVNGYGDGRFGTNDPVSREQLATFLYRYAQYKGQGFTGSWMFLLDFTDRADISEWADEAVHWCSMKGVVNGKDGSVFDPQGTATRAEAASMMQRFCEALEK